MWGSLLESNEINIKNEGAALEDEYSNIDFK